MARIGSFDREIRDTAWFDRDAVAEGWFEDDLIDEGFVGESETPTPGGALAAGFSPVARVSATISGGVGGGAGPASAAPVSPGGASTATSGFLALESDGTSHFLLEDGSGALLLEASVSNEIRARVDLSIGGAVAGGNAPSAPVFETPTPGGAIAAGNGPTAAVPVAQGGGTAQGVTQNAAVAAHTIGGALAAGQQQGASTTIGQGGGTGQGNGPSPAVVSLTIGGATAGGFSPTESEATEETPTPGGAIAAGNGPSATVPAAQGGAPAAGNGPSAVAAHTVGGAFAGGQQQGASTTVGQGGGTGQGNGPSPAVVSLTIGGAAAGGFGPTDQFTVEETPAPGGAIAGGFDLGAAAQVGQGGGTGEGVGPTPVLVAVPAGGAVAGGNSPTAGQPVEFPEGPSGHLNRPTNGFIHYGTTGGLAVRNRNGSITGTGEGHIEQPTTGSIA